MAAKSENVFGFRLVLNGKLKMTCKCIVVEDEECVLIVTDRKLDD